jgi:hypothetical protein
MNLYKKINIMTTVARNEKNYASEIILAFFQGEPIEKEATE